MTRRDPAIVGLIGYGALARETVAALKDETVSWVVLLRDMSRTSVPDGMTVVTSAQEMATCRPLVVIEAAGQASVAAYVPALLRSGIPVIVASIGALADETIEADIARATASSTTRIIIPSGAIGGLDYLAAVAPLEDTRVRYIQRKPVAAWQAELTALGLSRPDAPVVLFEGSPRAAAQRYPKNLNAAYAATLTASPALVTVVVIADPAIDTNIHELEIESAAGTAQFRFANAASADNPKTSAMTAHSLAAAIRTVLAGKAGL
ncbi:DUF108 domain-containing protein [Rhizobium sp. CFBP 8762]|uniref:aspartate dehydrogenase domain-containing protein n=1 Tax=Rhizobium sp. CFBP 8762 TaxID=2775279 RepID=UPI00177C3B19|nr:aspartate dehydrogenase domain-containing protein [Rhizobium sp. CFBP 8762]MBD8556146.1 DUF108 domain-containing protein [Rhizobium sp. CFBP 8762]